VHANPRAGLEHVALARRRTVDHDAPVGDQALCLGTTADLRDLAHDHVDAVTGLVGPDYERECRRVSAQDAHHPIAGAAPTSADIDV
jgi:hypothetical protein